jgi:hypothetical protein
VPGNLGVQSNSVYLSASAANGGTGTGGDINLNGGIGSVGTIFVAAQNLSGAGGASMIGAGGGVISGTSAGSAGTGYGAGGGGGASVNAAGATSGGAGKAGICIIREYGY